MKPNYVAEHSRKSQFVRVKLCTNCARIQHFHTIEAWDSGSGTPRQRRDERRSGRTGSPTGKI